MSEKKCKTCGANAECELERKKKNENMNDDDVRLLKNYAVTSITQSEDYADAYSCTDG